MDIHEKIIGVRMGDIDFNGHPHNNRYLEYARHARASCSGELNFPAGHVYQSASDQ
jgi:acyl-CoA thioesterase FadM